MVKRFDWQTHRKVKTRIKGFVGEKIARLYAYPPDSDGTIEHLDASNKARFRKGSERYRSPNNDRALAARKNRITLPTLKFLKGRSK